MYIKKNLYFFKSLEPYLLEVHLLRIYSSEAIEFFNTQSSNFQNTYNTILQELNRFGEEFWFFDKNPHDLDKTSLNTKFYNRPDDFDYSVHYYQDPFDYG